MKLYFYSRPPTARVRLTLDSGSIYTADAPTTANGRDDAHVLELPDNTPYQGATLHVEADGYQAFDGRGIIDYGVNSGDGATVLQFHFDDVYLTETAVPPEPPEPPPEPLPEGPPNPADPWSVIQWVYAGGTGVIFDLAFHQGCGQFTEACALALFQFTARAWGHVKKNPGQNQYQGHAVDAVHCISGDDSGIWDIITDSVSHNAAPAFNRAGDAEPEIWYPPIGPPPAIVVLYDPLAPADRVSTF